MQQQRKTKRERTEWDGSSHNGSIFHGVCDAEHRDFHLRPGIHTTSCIGEDDECSRASFHVLPQFPLAIYFQKIWYDRAIYNKTLGIDEVRWNINRTCCWQWPVPLSLWSYLATCWGKILTGFFYRSMLLLLYVNPLIILMHRAISYFRFFWWMFFFFFHFHVFNCNICYVMLVEHLLIYI